MLKKPSRNRDAGRRGAAAKTFACPVHGCDQKAVYVRFVAFEYLVRFDQTLEDIEAIATRKRNAAAMEARNLLVQCPVHGEKIIQRIGHHMTDSKKRKQP